VSLLICGLWHTQKCLHAYFKIHTLETQACRLSGYRQTSNQLSVEQCMVSEFPFSPHRGFINHNHVVGWCPSHQSLKKKVQYPHFYVEVSLRRQREEMTSPLSSLTESTLLEGPIIKLKWSHITDVVDL
jgi:hypothetical protein